MGLPESERIVADPRPPEERRHRLRLRARASCGATAPTAALYKTTDGGKTWALVLKGANLSTGCSGLDDGPEEPRRALRRACGTSAARAGRSAPAATAPTRRAAAASSAPTDGGKTWTELTAATNKGLPAKPVGPRRGRRSRRRTRRSSTRSSSRRTRRSTARPTAARPGRRATTARCMVWRPFYFARLVVDPTNPDRVFKPDVGLDRERGRRQELRRHAAAARTATGTTSGSIPTNPKHVIGGDDGGLWISYDGGNRWWKANNLPISQFYHVSRRRRRTRTRSTAACRTTAPGSATPRIPAASRTRAGRTSTAATASGRSPIPTDPDAVYAESQGGYIGRVDRKHARARATSSRRPATRRSCASTGTRRSTRARRRRARSTSARSSSSARATAATPGSASRRI